MNNDFSLLSTKIEDNKQEKISFVVDLHEEIFKEDFIGVNNEKVERINVIFDEICNFVKLKDYFSSKATEFALFTYTDKLNKEIDFSGLKEFINDLVQVRNKIKNQVVAFSDYLDLTEIYSESINYLGKLNVNFNKESNFVYNNEIILRTILFYNRSEIPAINSNEKDFNLITFIRLTNFYFDVIFFRKKINSDDDKRILTEVFNSLTTVKPKFWYAFEISGNINKFKFTMNLLLANPNQRVKLSEIDKYQKGVEEIIKNYIDN
jgi:hypothetical protein